jgi:hypothetical protein
MDFSPTADFGCYVTVENECNTGLMLTEKHKNDKAKWLVEPPPGISKNSQFQFVLKDAPGLEGTEGSVVYTLDVPGDPKPELTLAFSCPTKPTSQNTFKAESSDPSTMAVEKNLKSPHGHPMYGKDFPSKFLQSFSP